MRIARVYFDVHMGQAFAGLLKICHDSGYKPETKEESYVVFVNRKRTKFKLLIGNQYMVYHDNRNRPFPLEAIKYIPQAFSGKKFTFDTAVEKAVREKIISNPQIFKAKKFGAVDLHS